MKNLKLLKTILSLLLISSTVLTLFSCVNNEDKITDKSTDETIHSDIITGEATNKKVYDWEDYDKVKDYKLISVDDGYRLVFDNLEVYEQTDFYPMHFIGPEFKTITDFRNTFINGTLTFSDKYRLFKYNHKDNIGMIIPNLDNLYIPVLPSDYPKVEMKNVPVSCNLRDSYKYDIVFIDPDKSIDPDIPLTIYEHISIKFLTRETYEADLEKAKSVKEYISSNIWTHENGKSSTTYKILSHQYERSVYTVSNENKTMHVIEDYSLDEKGNRGTTPYLNVFYETNGAYFNIYMDYNQLVNIEPRTSEWLFEFDVEKYVPENT